MPPKGRSKAQAARNNFLGVYQSNNKIINEMNKKIEDQESIIKQRELVLKQLDIELKEVNKVIDSKKVQLDYKKKLLQQIEAKSTVVAKEVKVKRGKFQVKITSCLSNNRKSNPTSRKLGRKAKEIRGKETINACMAIHGASNTNLEPAVIGMLETLTTKCNSKYLSEQILTSKESLVSNIKDKVIINWSKEYYKSHENSLRSLNAYYSHNVLGKKKYMQIRIANFNAKYENIRIPNYIPYNQLSKVINEVDIGNISSVNSLHETTEPVKGMFRNPLEYIVRVAKFYLYVNQYRSDKLKLFPNLQRKDKDSVLFVLAIGGDGAPQCGMSILLSFLNVGKRIASSDEQFLLFGADVAENSIYVAKFFHLLIKDIKYLESKVFEIEAANKTFKVEFKLGELPNDMKMMAFLAGELSNSSFYFSTFGNVNQDNSNDFKKSFGKEWKPICFKKRIADVEKVLIKKAELGKSKQAEAGKWTKLTSFISKELRSRQEEYPLVDSYVDRAKAEPLHLKNNTVKKCFIQIFKTRGTAAGEVYQILFR